MDSFGLRRLGSTRRRLALEMAGIGAASLVVVTLVAGFLESSLGVADASSVYLLAVVAMAIRFGLWPAVGTSLLSVLIYDLLFTAPRLTLTVADPQEWLSLLLFLVVAVVTARLAALEAERAHDATRRADEARSLFAISRSLATAESVQVAARDIVERLRAEAAMDGVWIGLGPNPAGERGLADAASGRPSPVPTVHWLLHRGKGETADQWVRTHTGKAAARPGTLAAPGKAEHGEVFRVVIEAGGQSFGSVWAIRAHTAGLPGPTATRLLSLAADQMALALRREQLASEATKAEVARRGDALKTALLDSVSHGLRTPLATIRALAGGLLDEEAANSPEATRRAADAIDDEAARLSEVVRNVLDLSRIEGNALRAELEVHELGELVRGAIRREEGIVTRSRVQLDLPDNLPPVVVDAVFLDQALANVLENAAAYAGERAPIRVRAEAETGRFVDLLVEDGGPGVPDQELDRLFEKFFRRAGPRGSRAGLGIGLSVARGLVEAMGGRMSAERSELGGLAIRFRLPRAGEAGIGTPPAATVPPVEADLATPR